MTEDKTGYELLEECKESVIEEVKTAIDDYISDNPGSDKDDIRDNIDHSGRITEIYDGCVPIYNYDIMRIGSLPEVYQHKNEIGPAFDGTPTPINIIAGSIYEILSEVAWETIDEYLEELEVKGKFEGDDDE